MSDFKYIHTVNGVVGYFDKEQNIILPVRGKIKLKTLLVDDYRELKHQQALAISTDVRMGAEQFYGMILVEY